MSPEVVEVTDILDAAGNTAKAITKSFAISAAARAVLALFSAYASEVYQAMLELNIAGAVPMTISLLDPWVIVGVFLGAATLPLFQRTDHALGHAQRLRHDRGRSVGSSVSVLASSPGREEPDYVALCLTGLTGCPRGVDPALLAVLMLPLIIGFLMGPEALGRLPRWFDLHGHPLCAPDGQRRWPVG